MSKKHQPKSGSNKVRSKVVELRPKPSPTPAGALPERVAALEQNQLGLVNMFNQNMGAFKGGMLAVDAMLHVQQRVMHDLVGQMQNEGRLSGFARTRPTGNGEEVEGVSVYMDTDGMVDFARYIREYYGVAGFVEFMAAFNEWRRSHHVVKLPDGTFDVVSIADVVKEAEQAEEMTQAIAGPEDDAEEVVTVFGGDGGGS